jgi:SulP family sulfate permease
MKNVLGAFSDGAILFPLIAALSLQGAIPVDKLLLTAGLAYLVSGLFFRIPMPVQPLKSIAIAAVAVHATGAEIRVSGAFLGLVCLLLALLVQNQKINSWVRMLPPFFIQALQTALGVILAIQGLKILMPLPIFEKVAALAMLIVMFAFSSLPVLGVLATLGLLVGVFLNAKGAPEMVSTANDAQAVRPIMILSLVLPQIALTFANSVVSTRVIAHQYFGSLAKRVTDRALLTSIGLGNLVVAAVGGLPYCHGSGGLTAHYRGGSRTYHSNLIIGTVLVLFAIATHFGQSVVLHYPLFLLGPLLIAIGWFHFGLVRKQESQPDVRKLLVVAIIAAFTHAMSWPLIAAVVFCLPFDKFKNLAASRLNS